MKPIKLVIADDHPITAEGLRNLLLPYSQFEVCATYNSGEQLLAGLSKMLPDVLLLDIHFPDTTGNELIRIIARQYPKLKVLALTSAENPFDIKDMMQHGCLGYVLKSTSLSNLIEAIETVFEGRQFLNEALKEQLFQTMLQPRQRRPSDYKLTRREQTVLRLVYEGKTNNEIAGQLFVSERTIENNRLSLYKKLGVRNTAELIKTGLQQGLIT